MNKYNNKKDEKIANEALLAIVVVACVIIIINYVTI